MENYQSDLEVLRNFLSLPHRASSVLEKFATLPGAIVKSEGPMENFVYIPGTRKNPVLLVAHSDTADWWMPEDIELYEGQSEISNGNGLLGADDRAGCAMLWLLRNTGHGLLITDGEERGGYGSAFLRWVHPKILREINRHHQFMIQIDLHGRNQFKCYGVGTAEFRAYIRQKTSFSEPDQANFTDIVTLCTGICGVNLSCGYYEEHTPSECIVKQEWHDTLQLLRSWLAETDLPRFQLPRKGKTRQAARSTNEKRVR